MSVPSPSVDINDGCSAIYQNTLYTYQWNAFQSIPLSEGASWTQHPSNGVAVNGSKCVIGCQDGTDVLFVVGGTASDSSYTGLQRFNFADKKWETITSPGPVSVVQNRVMHGVAYLKSPQSIVIYSGWQDNQPINSSQTFTISTQAPYRMESYVSNNAPTVMDPIVQPWNDTHAYMAGGSVANQAVWTFSPSSGWNQVNVVLPQGLPDMTKVQASLVRGEDQSKVLQLFDMGASPNTVTSLLVEAENGVPFPQNNADVALREPKVLENRALNLTDMPQYNGTLAPTTVRNGFSLARTANGMVIVSGGNAAQPLSMFNQTSNSWIDAETFFGSSVSPTPAAASSTPSALPTTIPTSTSTNAPAAAPMSGSTMKTIIGGVLGGLFGLIAIAIIALLIFRARKQRRNREQFIEYSAENKETTLPSGNPSPAIYARGPSPNPSENSNYSNPVEKNMISYPVQNVQDSMDGNRLTAFPSVFANSTSVRPVQPPRNGPRGDRSDEGWSQYFEEDQQNGVAGAVPRFAPVPRDGGYTDQSEYTSSSSNLHPSAEIAPLNVGSSRLPPTRPPRPEDSETFLESNSSEPGQESWDPVGTSQDRTWERRPASSIYTEGAPLTHPVERNLLSRFPGVPSFAPPGQNRETRLASQDFFSGGHAGPRSAGDVSGTRRDTDDMSWLNLRAGGK